MCSIPRQRWEMEQSKSWSVRSVQIMYCIQYGGRLPWDATAICTGDDFGGRGGPKRGEHYAAAPNIDHSNPRIRNDLIEWMKFMRTSIGFDGWRFDFVKGYPGETLKEYIDSTVPELSVGELWDTCEYTNSVLNYNQVKLFLRLQWAPVPCLKHITDVECSVRIRGSYGQQSGSCLFHTSEWSKKQENSMDSGSWICKVGCSYISLCWSLSAADAHATLKNQN